MIKTELELETLGQELLEDLQLDLTHQVDVNLLEVFRPGDC